jgi:hypothetical protein
MPGVDSQRCDLPADNSPTEPVLLGGLNAIAIATKNMGERLDLSSPSAHTKYDSSRPVKRARMRWWANLTIAEPQILP